MNKRLVVCRAQTQTYKQQSGRAPALPATAQAQLQSLPPAQIRQLRPNRHTHTHTSTKRASKENKKNEKSNSVQNHVHDHKHDQLQPNHKRRLRQGKARCWLAPALPVRAAPHTARRPPASNTSNKLRRAECYNLVSRSRKLRPDRHRHHRHLQRCRPQEHLNRWLPLVRLLRPAARATHQATASTNNSQATDAPRPPTF